MTGLLEKIKDRFSNRPPEHDVTEFGGDVTNELPVNDNLTETFEKPKSSHVGRILTNALFAGLMGIVATFSIYFVPKNSTTIVYGLHGPRIDKNKTYQTVGPHFKIPFVEKTFNVPNYVRQESKWGHLFSGDNNEISVDISVDYKMKNPWDYFKCMEKARRLGYEEKQFLEVFAVGNVNDVLSSMPLDSIMSNRKDADRKIMSGLQNELDRQGSGLEVLSYRTNVIYLDKPRHK